MGGHMSKKALETTLDAHLQSFDTTLQARMNQAINTLEVGVKQRALSFDSLREVMDFQLDMSQEAVKVILECKENIWENQELFKLVEEFFKNSLLILRFCTKLEKCLIRVRGRQLLIRLALQYFDEETEVGGSGYARTLQKLKNFKAAEDPFTTEFFQIFESVYRQNKLMLEKLQHHNKKLGKKLNCIQVLKVLSVISVATLAIVLMICSVVAAVAMTTHPLAAALPAPTPVFVDSMGKWIKSLWKNYENAANVLKGQKEILSPMQVGTYIAIKDLENIRVLIDRLQSNIESLVQSAEVASEEEALKSVIEDIKKELGMFTKNVEELRVQVDTCSRNILNARTEVLERIKKYPNN